MACFGYVSEEAREAGDLCVATCDLAGGDGSASGPRWEPAKCKTVGRRFSPWAATAPDVAVCAGRTYLYYHNGGVGGAGAQVHVLTPRGRGRLVEVDAVGEPAVMRAPLGAHAGETARRLAQARFRGGAMVAARVGHGRRRFLRQGAWRGDGRGGAGHGGGGCGGCRARGTCGSTWRG